MHASRVVPDEERLAGLLGIIAVEEVDHLGRDLLIHGPRPFQGERTFVLAGLVGHGPIGGFTPDDWAWRREAGSGLWINRAWDLGQTRDRCVLAWRRDG